MSAVRCRFKNDPQGPAGQLACSNSREEWQIVIQYRQLGGQQRTLQLDHRSGRIREGVQKVAGVAVETQTDTGVALITREVNKLEGW